VPTASIPVSEATASSRRVELILAQLEQLPTLPAVATRLLQVTTSESSSAADVSAIVETDQALTAKVLALVRRASLGVREATTVERAIVMLGFEAVRNAVLAVQIYETFRSAEPQDGALLDRVEFWKHSLAVACAARLIAERLRLGKRKDEAFVCGLLHDLGKVALDACLPKSYARILRETQSGGRCLCDVERDLLGLDHTVAGKRLANRWKLPQSIVECIWLHHQAPVSLPTSLVTPELVRVVHLADHLVRYLRIGFSGYNHIEPPAAVAQAVGLDPLHVQAIIDALPEELERNCQLVGIDQLTGTDLYAKAVSEANIELGRLNAALTDANRRLGLRARCFDALGAFTRALTLDDQVATVCATAARCVKDVLAVKNAVGFHYDAHTALYHAGACGPNGVEAVVLTASSHGSASTGRLSAGGASVGPPPAMAQPVIERFLPMLSPGTVRMWPMVHAGLVIGGVLFAEDAEGLEALPATAAEFDVLGVAFGLALAGAADRARSDRLHEELADANRQLHEARGELLRAQSIRMIAETAAGAAHELNNPLAVISGRAQMLAQRAADPEDQRIAEIIHQHARRASDIVSELVQYAKPDPPAAAIIPLAAGLKELCAHWEQHSSLRAGQLQATLSDPNVCVACDPRQLRQILDALLANAVDATEPENACVLINSTSTTSDDRIVVRVTDNGCGMTPEVLEHAADPFFSHRTAGRGRGMGLSQATRLATNNGGRLWLESTPGKGTTAFLDLPAAPG
jgi:putative nucleotidyltransferase with HDIG domain